MADIHQTMYDMALEPRKAHTTHAENFGDFMDGVKKGFVKAPWCADPDCEIEIKCVTGASTRCKPMDEDTSVIHDDAVVDEFLHVLNDMRREEYGRAAAAGIVAQVLHEQSAVTRVESHREIVEDHQIGVLRQNQPQSYL